MARSRSPPRRGDHCASGSAERGAQPARPSTPGKSGQQKAEREREKARLKKSEREKVQAREAQKERQQSSDAARSELSEAKAAAAAAAAPAIGPVTEEVAAARATKPATRRSSLGKAKSGGAVVEEALARKLFAMLDRGNKDVVSPRDVLVALKKHPQVRRLFRLPANSMEEGGASLEARLLAIQDAFEASSGLGEVAHVFAELRDGSGGEGQAFRWEAFWASCRRGTLRATAAAAIALLPREHATLMTFVPTSRWTEVPEGAACPSGLEFKMDVSTGRTLARLPPRKS
mmetsp:Transcript_35657/g.102720  ORF Transcript_35657/g.102720 Transcript_35657/m.102720 type:complete len:289 (-) Transcript_35657:168-1034(-)